MPPIYFEVSVVRKIGKGFEQLGRILASWPAGRSTSTRNAGPANMILDAVTEIDSLMEKSAKQGTITKQTFTDLAGEFAKISGALLIAAEGASTRKTKG